MEGYHVELDLLRHLFMHDPGTTAMTGLRFVHFIGLAIGLGGATMLDLMLLRFFVRQRIASETLSIFEFSSRIVGCGLWILWFTGLGFLTIYALDDASKLTNPKVHAKLVIVLLLTMNGLFIHRRILPVLKDRVGQCLFTGMAPRQRVVLTVSGSISAVSWYVPVALGAFSQLNDLVPASAILAIYATLLVSTTAAMYIFMRLASPRTCRQSRARTAMAARLSSRADRA
ncbi:MAG: hypothetical protein AAF264_00600 [Pseudomonadota bacterium]